MKTRPLTIEEIESACNQKQSLDFSRHEVEGPELLLKRRFYPLGFPTEIRTNSEQVIALYKEAWGMFKKRFDTALIRVDVKVIESAESDCPPVPNHGVIRPVLACIADRENFSFTDLERSTTQITISTTALKFPKYVRYFFLDAAAAVHVLTKHGTPLHAACVALNNRGVLLCGDSGAGKSSLSYACAVAGFTYVSDDCTILLNGGKNLTLTGDCHRVRLRPSAASLFPEINGLKMTPRAAGKPTIEMMTATMTNLVCSSTAKAESLVFLNRRRGGLPVLRPYRRDVARYALRQVLYGTDETLARQYEAIERLLQVELLELCYTDISWAVARLERFMREGS